MLYDRLIIWDSAFVAVYETEYTTKLIGFFVADNLSLLVPNRSSINTT